MLIILCQVLCMTLWFSASAAMPDLIISGHIELEWASLLTSAVQLGFVAGTLISGYLGLADKFDPRRVFAVSGIAGSLFNVIVIFIGFNALLTIVLRFLTGVVMAGIYPVGMKMAAAWEKRDIGLMMGALVGALTLGSALPHLFTSISHLDWRVVMYAASACSLVGAFLILLVGLGPAYQKSHIFHPGEAMRALRKRSVQLVNAGYLGHMWELYAMWTWIGTFLVWGLRQQGVDSSQLSPALVTFFVVASGAVGCLAAGALADRFGRTIITITAMIVSGLCAVFIGQTIVAGPAVLIVVAIIWGVTIVADSAQFSAAIVELTESCLVGSMLTIQTCLGFVFTFVAVQLMPVMIDRLTWRYAFASLALGPFLGALSMWRLRYQPDSVRLAGGHR